MIYKLLLVSFFMLSSSLYARIWTNDANQRFEGELLSIANGKMKIQRNDGRIFDIPWRQLSKPDLYYCKEWQENPDSSANRLDMNGLIKGIKQDMSVDFNASVPPLTMFFEQSEADYATTNYSEDKKAAGKTKRFLKDYKEFLGEFFSLTNPKLKIKSHTFSYKKPLYIVTEATHVKSEVKLNSLVIFKYLSGVETKSLSKAVVYFNEKPEVLDQAILVLGKYSKLSEKGIVGEKTIHSSYIINLMKKCITGLTELRTKRALNRDVIKDLTVLAKELKIQP